MFAYQGMCSTSVFNSNSAKEGGSIYSQGNFKLHRYNGGNNEGDDSPAVSMHSIDGTSSVDISLANLNCDRIRTDSNVILQYDVKRRTQSNSKKSFGEPFLIVSDPKEFKSIQTEGQIAEFSVVSFSDLSGKATLLCNATGNTDRVICELPFGVGTGIVNTRIGDICTFKMNISYEIPTISNAVYITRNIIRVEGNNFGRETNDIMAYVSSSFGIKKVGSVSILKNSTLLSVTLALSDDEKNNYSSLTLIVGGQSVVYYFDGSRTTTLSPSTIPSSSTTPPSVSSTYTTSSMTETESPSTSLPTTKIPIMTTTTSTSTLVVVPATTAPDENGDVPTSVVTTGSSTISPTTESTTINTSVPTSTENSFPTSTVAPLTTEISTLLPSSAPPTTNPPQQITESDLPQLIHNIENNNSTQLSSAINSVVVQFFNNQSASNPVSFSSTNVSLTAFHIRNEENQLISLKISSSGDETSTIPQSIFASLSKNLEEEPAFVVFSSFNSNGKFQSQNTEILASKIYGLSILDINGKEVNVKDSVDPISIVMSINELNQKDSDLICIFWDEEKNEWSEEGCKTNRLNPQHLECLVTHLTNFTVGRLTKGKEEINNVINGGKTSGKSSLHIIIGASIGGLVVLLSLFVLIIVIVKRRRGKKEMMETELGVLDASEEVVCDGNIESQLEMMEKTGQGAFGQVFKAIYNGHTDVAVKKLNKDADRKQFMREANITRNLHHPNICQYIGLFEDSEGQICMILEYMSEGDLLSYLQREHLSAEQKMKIAMDLAGAMAYLEEKNIIHCDVAARNVLYSGTIAKLGDFGMACKSIHGSEVRDGKSPIRWSPPEVITEHRYSHAGDVWSYGILVWELYSEGKVPYADKDNKEVAVFVNNGGRLILPRSISESLKPLLVRCWEGNPHLRPSFREICAILSVNASPALSISSTASFYGRSNSQIVTKKKSSSLYEGISENFES
eukprot:TRINITY_DN8700_c0_g1_i3.p1 TRINITY_DN8700_c0_g1~~TRINITY_DN8700_c0_g1_i3.p1  ORF type:complete len:963 (-),score=322.25 TRINITY_DN8700_c0_g1_i3:51-2939(-)